MLKEIDLHVFDEFHSAMWVFDSTKLRIHWANHEAIAFWRKKNHQELYDYDFSDNLTEADLAVIRDDLEDYALGRDKSQWCAYKPIDITKEVYCHFSGVELNDGRIETLVQVIVSKVSLDSELSVHTTSTLVSLWDVNGRVTSSNQLFQQFYSQKKEFFHQLFNNQIQADELWREAIEEGVANRELCLPTLEGNRWFQINLSLNKKGHTERVTLRQLDTTARKHRELHHQKLAITDQLTQIQNRFGVTVTIEKIINSRTPFTLFLIDLNKFKNINDYYGHDKGDALLKAVAFRLQSIFINALAISRLGGDEFLLIMPYKGAENKQTEGAKLTRCLNTPYHISGLGNVQSGGSIGVVSYPADADNMSELLLLADTAMYCAKTSHFDDCSYFNSEMAQPLMRRQKIRNSLSSAISNLDFLHHFEPVFSIADRTIAYCEIQTCWLHQELGMLQSEDFYDIADELSVMSAIELQTLERACKQILNDDQQTPIILKVTINEFQSGRTFKNLEKLSTYIKQIPFKLNIALSESDVTGREDSIIQQMEKVVELQIGVVLDDFSIGGINLTKLPLLPINIIRFHSEFTASLSQQKNCLLKSFALSMKQSGYKIICTGVSDLETINLLMPIGCDFVQDLPIYLFENNQFHSSIIEKV